LYDGKPKEFHLCEQHCKDPDFEDYVIETKLDVKKTGATVREKSEK